MKLAEMINQYLKDTGTTLKELANKIEMDSVSLERVCNGAAPIRVRELDNLITYLDKQGWDYKDYLEK